MIKLFLMGIVVIVAALGIGLGIQHVMAFDVCPGCTMCVNITVIATVVMIPIVGITTADKSSYFIYQRWIYR
jgi:hypothetical protein